MEDAVRVAIQRCPFLGKVSLQQGEAFAQQIAIRPNSPVCPRGPVVEEDSSSFESTLQLFHGPSGIVPLKRFSGESGCPYRATAQNKTTGFGLFKEKLDPNEPATAVSSQLQARPAGMASLSLSSFGFLHDPRNLLNFLKLKGQQHKTNKPQQGKSQGSQFKGKSGRPPAGTGSTGRGPVKLSAAAPVEGGLCPFRKFYEPLGGLLAMTAKGELKCPPAVTRMRAAVARLKPVKELRPKALPVKLLAVGALGLASNLPLGMWREHLAKFSPGWFFAIHASIPFIALLRKAVLMPPWAIVLTISASLAGQIVGARLERARLSSAFGVAAAPSVAAGVGVDVGGVGAEILEAVPRKRAGFRGVFRRRAAYAAAAGVANGDGVAPEGAHALRGGRRRQFIGARALRRALGTVEGLEGGPAMGCGTASLGGPGLGSGLNSGVAVPVS